MKVLFATDGSCNAREAAKFLSQLEFSTPPNFIVATVSYDPALAANEHIAWAQEWRDWETERVQSVQDETTALIAGLGNSVRRIHRIGAPQRELLEIAKEEDVDLIVIGAVGHSAVRRLLLGSVSDHIATHAECSVLIVRPEGIESGVPLQSVMVAYDGSKPAQRTIDELATYGISPDAEISIATVLHEYDYMATDAIAETIYQRQSEWLPNSRRIIRTWSFA